MHLASVEIKNFRSLKSLSLEFAPGLNVLVGRNNTGKTNLFHAIRHALGPSASRGDSLWLERDDFYRRSPTEDHESMLSVTLTFAELSDAQRAHFFEIVNFDLANLDNSTAIVRFEASWPKGKKQASIKRTGGPIAVEPPEVPTELLKSLPITFLPALRDADASLAPGYKSRLALLLKDLLDRQGDQEKEKFLRIFAVANRRLERRPVVRDVRESLQVSTKRLAGTDHVDSSVTAADMELDRILRSLQVQMVGSPIGALDANGLGYNNLLYMAVVLEHLKQDPADEFPMLLVEEPEAHLHPQLTMLLADYLATTTPGASAPQTLVTTHSPTLAASVPPHRVHVLFTDPCTSLPRCNSVSKSGMDDKQQAELQRMMDITRATLYFAKGAILVEGISESLLIPSLAKRLGHDLMREHISVIPICGVAFETFKKLLDPSALGIPVAIITDADPPVPRKTKWEDEEPEMDGAAFKVCDRTRKLLSIFSGHQTVRVKHAKLTLEYDLAEAGDSNAAIMAEAWEACYQRTPGTFTVARVTQAGSNRHDKALAAWRGICRADPSVSKAEFAHRLAAKLIGEDGSGQSPLNFVTPNYIKEAIKHVVNSLKTTAPATGATVP
jgi:putative ATP-dependent endonuclease of OLD family